MPLPDPNGQRHRAHILSEWLPMIRTNSPTDGLARMALDRPGTTANKRPAGILTPLRFAIAARVL